jgi:hypothetical protein
MATARYLWTRAVNELRAVESELARMDAQEGASDTPQRRAKIARIQQLKASVNKLRKARRADERW